MYLSRKEGSAMKRDSPKNAPQFGIISPDKHDFAGAENSGWRYQAYTQQNRVLDEYRKTTESSVHKPRTEEQRFNMYIQDENYYNEKSPISDMKRQRVQ
mmetsp:Transcript_29098/g.28130  ORF Transcript_29098/g.28130 Transcript_29098/m.28130 type:complete len:99 (+) Transcript_29098:550-846(+)